MLAYDADADPSPDSHSDSDPDSDSHGIPDPDTNLSYVGPVSEIVACTVCRRGCCAGGCLWNCSTKQKCMLPGTRVM